MPELDRSTIVGSWLHAHEEDDGHHTVYRPDDYPFPPSRGRVGYEFRADGTVVVRTPGPVDRAVTQTGQWALGADGVLELRLGSGAVRRFRILEAGSDRLVMDPA